MDSVIKEAKRKLRKIGFGYIKLRKVRSSEGLYDHGRLRPYYTHELIVIGVGRNTAKKDVDFCIKKYGDSCYAMRIDELKALKKVFGKYPKFGYYTLDSRGYYFER